MYSLKLIQDLVLLLLCMIGPEFLLRSDVPYLQMRETNMTIQPRGQLQVHPRNLVDPNKQHVQLRQSLTIMTMRKIMFHLQEVLNLEVHEAKIMIIILPVHLRTEKSSEDLSCQGVDVLQDAVQQDLAEDGLSQRLLMLLYLLKMKEMIMMMLMSRNEGDLQDL